MRVEETEEPDAYHIYVVIKGIVVFSVKEFLRLYGLPKKRLGKKAYHQLHILLFQSHYIIS